MKVILSNYRNHWLSPYIILKKICFWEKDEDRIYNLKDDPNNPYEKWVNFLDPICKVWQKILDIVHPRVMYVKIDQWDSWSADHTLSLIILPVMKQLKETKHGAPFVDDEDVPEELRSINAEPKENEWDTDSNHFKRWDYIMDEVIWALEQHTKDDDESQFFDHSAYKEDSHKEWLDDLTKGVSKVKVDQKGLKTHQERKLNGFRLMGKYWTGFWD
jgi:hypothetical protein